MKGDITMSNKELRRLEVIQKTVDKRITQSQASEMLSLSIRQTKRLCKNYKEHGAYGLVSKKRGKPSNNRLTEEVREKVLSLILNDYIDFGPTLAHEKITEKHNIFISVSSVRNIMIANNIWEGKKKKTKRVHQLRKRRDAYGELIQIDGSPHAWFEERGPECSLLAYVDDATTNIMHLKFVEAETTWNYINTTEEYVTQHGRPDAIYSDKHAIFKVNRESSLQKDKLTQYGRVLQELEIKLICANTPQAKGRVERIFKTLQDRLVKELRLRNISTIEEANAYLPSFIEKYNRRFSKPAKSPFNAHRSIKNLDLNRIFTIQHTRHLSKNLILQYKNVLYQIKTTRPGYALRKAAVKILEKQSGEICIEYKGKPLDYVVYHEQQCQGKVVSSKLINYEMDQIQKKKYKPSRYHPWRRYKNKPQLLAWMN